VIVYLYQKIILLRFRDISFTLGNTVLPENTEYVNTAPGGFVWWVDFGLGQNYYNLSKSTVNAAVLCVRD